MIDTAHDLSTYSRFSVNKCLKNILLRSLPPVCLVCGAAQAGSDHLCACCRSDLPHRPVVQLENVAVSVGSDQMGPVRDAQLVENCLVPLRYAWPVDHLITSLKFRERLVCARPLAHMLVEAAAASVQQPDLLIPVPLYRRRQRQRGFNQSAEIARRVARELGLQMDCRALKRIRNTLAQSELDRLQRAANVRGAFRASSRVQGLHVVLIDDVLTTGATLRAAAEALRDAGAARVDAWCVARAELDGRDGPRP